MMTRKLWLLIMYAALGVSLLLPSKASQMSSQLGEQVVAWEPAINLHFRVLLAPAMEIMDTLGFLSSLGTDGERQTLWVQALHQIVYWLPITLAGWLMLLYPLVYQSTLTPARRYLRWTALLIAVTGTGLLAHHLVHWATLYAGYYHMGMGGYFAMLAFGALCALLLCDVWEKRAK
jgi:hypothetical protein